MLRKNKKCIDVEITISDSEIGTTVTVFPLTLNRASIINKSLKGEALHGTWSIEGLKALRGILDAAIKELTSARQ